MSRWIRRISLVAVVFTALLTMSSGTTPVAYCANCPEAHLSEGNFIKCLDGQQAWCKGGPKCACQGRIKKDNECAGACGVRTNWGACTIQCKKGVNASCIPGRSELSGFRQRIIEPVCSCGGPGRVGMVSPSKNKDDDMLAFSDKSMFSERVLNIIDAQPPAE